jgi:prostaglandin-endoperoxide synthase 2
MFQGIPSWLVRLVLWLAGKWPWLNSFINRAIINRSVQVARNRPHPWSTAHDYVSWTSLSDQRWSARHLAVEERKLALPDSDALTELFRRPAGVQRLCPKSTCLFPAFAQYLTDGFIRTRMPKTGEPQDLRLQNTSNHQIDLCPLYGLNSEDTYSLRLRSDEPGSRGLLKSQLINGEEFAPFLCANGKIKEEFKDLDEPLGFNDIDDPKFEPIRNMLFAFGGDRANAVPQVAALNTLFLREHNRLAKEIGRLNPSWDDDRVFETARATNIVCFIKVVVEDYINHIMPIPFRLTADPHIAWRAVWNRPNWITTEFSLLYRWHSLIPDAIRIGAETHPSDTLRMNNGPLVARGVRGLLEDLTRQAAGEIAPLNTADVLLKVEKEAIAQGRRARLQSYSAYRDYVGLSKPTSFDDISRRPEVVRELQRHYKSADEVDFYVGLFMEDRIENSPLPPLILHMVAMDAFSQALTNPLLSEHVFKESTFSQTGWRTIANTTSLDSILKRNSGGAQGSGSISMTNAGWRQKW